MDSIPFPDARILIVDDQEANIRLVELLLVEAGYRAIRSTTHPRQVAGIYAEYRPDLIVLDLHMPEMDGFEVLEQLASQIDPAVYMPILVLTADVTAQAKWRALSMGARDFLSKPLDAIEAILRIRNLLRTRELSLQLERTRREFISIVNHELRTPLTGIRGSLELLRGGVGGALPNQARNLVDMAYQNSQQLMRLIEDVLDIGRLEAGSMPFQIRRFELLPLLEQGLEVGRAYAAQFGVDFALDPLPRDARVQADPERLLQALSNLVFNAAKFSPRGSVARIGVEQWDGALRIIVRDQGPGIPEEFQQRVFEPFVQVDSSDTRRKGGMGLGLSLAQRIVERMGGRIGLETPPEGGAIFFIELPEA